MQEDRNLIARMMVICKRRPEIDIKEAVGTYEFRVAPQSMFAADGTLLHCPAKSALMRILVKFSSRKTSVELLTRSKSDPSNQPAIYVGWLFGWRYISSLNRVDEP